MGVGDKMLGGNLRWTSIPSRGSGNTPSRLHATETGISSGSVGQFGPSVALHRTLRASLLGVEVGEKLFPNLTTKLLQALTHCHMLNSNFVPRLPSPVRLCLSTSLSSRSGRPGATWSILTPQRSWSASRTTDAGTTRRSQNTSRRGSLGSTARLAERSASAGRAQEKKLLISLNLKRLVSDRC